MKHDFADGKYTVINDNGKLTALRNGEPWGRDLCGDNLIYWMLVDFDAMKEQRDELLEAAQKALQYLTDRGLANGQVGASLHNAIAKATSK